MNIRRNERLVEKLAAEYVLGTLRGGARRRFETMLRDDPILRRAVAEWQDRLHPLAEFAPDVKPGPQVWAAISNSVGLESAGTKSRRSFWLGLREDLSFWRGLGMTSTAVAAVLIGVLATKSPDQIVPTTTFVAMLSDDKSQPVAVVTGNAAKHTLVVKVVAQQNVAADKSLELWAVPKEGAPRSLGLLAADGSITLKLPDNATPQSIPLLAVTLEPKGGSPNPNGPTGPIVFKGPWVQI